MYDLPSIDTSSRLIHGSLLKCVDGHWTADGGELTGRKFLALHLTRAAQRWFDQTPVETICEDQKELPDIDELNAAIPQREWEDGLDGKPRPPWQLQFCIYLLDPQDAGLFTVVNSTVGLRIAFERLRDKVQWMRALRGANVFPMVELAAVIMKTRMGKKLRPEFKIAEWTALGGNGDAPKLQRQEVRQIGKPVAEPTLREEMEAAGDGIPNWDRDGDEIPFSVGAES